MNSDHNVPPMEEEDEDMQIRGGEHAYSVETPSPPEVSSTGGRSTNTLEVNYGGADGKLYKDVHYVDLNAHGVKCYSCLGRATPAEDACRNCREPIFFFAVTPDNQNAVDIAACYGCHFNRAESEGTPIPRQACIKCRRMQHYYVQCDHPDCRDRKGGALWHSTAAIDGGTPPYEISKSPVFFCSKSHQDAAVTVTVTYLVDCTEETRRIVKLPGKYRIGTLMEELWWFVVSALGMEEDTGGYFFIDPKSTRDKPITVPWSMAIIELVRDCLEVGEIHITLMANSEIEAVTSRVRVGPGPDGTPVAFVEEEEEEEEEVHPVLEVRKVTPRESMKDFMRRYGCSNVPPSGEIHGMPCSVVDGYGVTTHYMVMQVKVRDLDRFPNHLDKLVLSPLRRNKRFMVIECASSDAAAALCDEVFALVCNIYNDNRARTVTGDARKRRKTTAERKRACKDPGLAMLDFVVRKVYGDVDDAAAADVNWDIFLTAFGTLSGFKLAMALPLPERLDACASMCRIMVGDITHGTSMDYVRAYEARLATVAVVEEEQDDGSPQPMDVVVPPPAILPEHLFDSLLTGDGGGRIGLSMSTPSSLWPMMDDDNFEHSQGYSSY
jgi:hypothetical protein